MKLYDITAVTGEYTDRNGQQKKRYQNVGAVMQGQNGGQYIVLERWFNPAGLPDQQGRGSVILSCYEPRQQGQQGGYGGQNGQQGGYGAQQGGYGGQNGYANQQNSQRQQLDDEIPF